VIWLGLQRSYATLYVLLPEEGACWWFKNWQVYGWFGFYLLTFVRVFLY